MSKYGSYDDATIALRKRQIEAQLDDYERAIADAAAFMDDWKARQRVSRETGFQQVDHNMVGK